MLLAVGFAGPVACAHAQTFDVESLRRPSPIGFDYFALVGKEIAPPDSTTPGRTPRLQLFRMPTGFLANPLDLVSDDDRAFDNDPAFAKSANDDDLSFLLVSVGQHAPNLDMFRHGDPGGLGYYRLHSQVQIFDFGTSSLCIGLQAYTPTGLAYGGSFNNGPTIVTPALAGFQELGDEIGIHAFISQPVAANSHWRDNLQTGLRCGLAVQRPVPGVLCNQDQGLFLFVQGLAQCQTGGFHEVGRASNWEIIPGVQWRVNTGCWLSVGVSHYNFVSCSWQF